jgi:hypothetical protein
MKRTIVSALGAATLAIAGLAAGISGATASPSDAGSAGALHAKRVCAAATSGSASCFAKVLVDSKGVVPASTTPAAGAKTPAQLKDAYKLTGTSGAGRTVAIVDAYGYGHLEADLATYRSYFGLPACTTASGCLTIVDQNGGTNYPRMDVGWAGEQALDVDAVSAICPDCKIVVVQASSASFANLGTAVVTASKLAGVVAISNSYGGGDAADTSYGQYYNHPGIAVTASTGDNGYKGGSYPSRCGAVRVRAARRTTRRSLLRPPSTPAVRSARWPTSPRRRTRATAVWRSTTRPAAPTRPGPRSVAPASRRRSSRRSTPWPVAATATRRPTPTRRACST